MISPVPVCLLFVVLVFVESANCFNVLFSSSSSQYPGPAQQRHHATHQGKKSAEKSDTSQPPNRKGNPAALSTRSKRHSPFNRSIQSSNVIRRTRHTGIILHLNANYQKAASYKLLHARSPH